MRRILLISDTHGDLDIINEKVAQTNADMVIHAGDFGFYDDQSVYRLSPRELRLSVAHSPVWRQYDVDKQTSREKLIEINTENKLLGDFPDYISGEKKFSVPVYAVWGNHEDVQVLRQLNTDLKVDNLYLLDKHNFYQFHSDDVLEFSLYGLGGNFLVSKKLFDKPIAGNGGKVWTTLHQFGVLYKKIKDKSKRSIFVSHVSPGKEPLLSRLIMHFMPTFWISGHMGAPFTCTWNQFTIREMSESLDWLDTDIGLIEEQYKQGRLTEEAALAFELIKKPISKEDTWYRKLWNINLPDAKDGHALLIVKDGKFSLETYSNGVQF
ncbi:metallophosphoesterase family protein [Legionella israelensis]|uniref:metallophosphoesterase family protein n=1 Tax=Legionella israelensis TaxID=454 RepID=UPI001180E938|nr:metallophosphoesterase [Legionella israelensis]QDP72137.1 metallophosphoesterase family protein [Legionella israelensis]